MVNKQRTIKLLQRLIKAKSENPPGNEKDAASIVEREMKEIGLRVKIYEFAKNRPNVIGILPGEKRKQELCLIAHLDTVPAGKGWHINPFRGIVKNGKVYGRGASDCKGNVAACIEAVHELVEEGFVPKSDIMLAMVVDEETGSKYGMIPLIRKGVIKAKNIVLLDSNDFKIVVSQKGLLHLKVKIFGKKAHGSRPELGINAIEHTAKIITDLKKHKFKGSHRILGGVTVNVGKIRGGEKVNIVADYCEFDIDLRYPPRINGKKLLKEVKKIIERTTKKYQIEILDAQNPYEGKNENLVKKLKCAMKKVGIEPKVTGVKGAIGFSFFNKRKFSIIGTGFSVSGQCHATDEYITIKNLIKGVEVLKEFIKLF